MTLSAETLKRAKVQMESTALKNVASGTNRVSRLLAAHDGYAPTLNLQQKREQYALSSPGYEEDLRFVPNQTPSHPGGSQETGTTRTTGSIQTVEPSDNDTDLLLGILATLFDGPDLQLGTMPVGNLSVKDRDSLVARLRTVMTVTEDARNDLRDRGILADQPQIVQTRMTELNALTALHPTAISDVPLTRETALMANVATRIAYVENIHVVDDNQGSILAKLEAAHGTPRPRHFFLIAPTGAGKSYLMDRHRATYQPSPPEMVVVTDPIQGQLRVMAQPVVHVECPSDGRPTALMRRCLAKLGIRWPTQERSIK